MFMSVDLPEPDCADDRDELAGVDREVDAVQHFDREIAGAVGLGDAGELDQRRRIWPCGVRRRGYRWGEFMFFHIDFHMRGCILGALLLPDLVAAAGFGAAAPVTTCSPGSRPETICAETRLMTPTRTSRSSSVPSGFTTRTIARPLAKRVRGSIVLSPLRVRRSRLSWPSPWTSLCPHRLGGLRPIRRAPGAMP